MKEFEIPPFYVGQEIVAVRNHSQGLFKAGDEFVVSSVSKCPCKCGEWDVTVGIAHDVGDFICYSCRGYYKSYGEALFSHYLFRAKIELSDFISMKQLAERQLETIGAN